MTAVEDLGNLVEVLRRQGALIESPEDLVPSLLGQDGYVGFRVRYADGHVERVWVKLAAAAFGGGDGPMVAEWLTLELVEAGGQLPVPELMSRYTERFAANVSGHGLFGVRYQLLEQRLAALGVLGRMAHRMGFVTNTLAQTISLPPDHPLAPRTHWSRKRRFSRPVRGGS